MIKTNFDFIAPESLSVAYERKKGNSNSVYLAGGTDYLPLLKYGLKEPECVLSLEGIKELKEIKSEERGLFVGSMVTLREVSKNNLVLELFPSLSEAARKVASPQIRNIGTIGGNILQDRRCLYFNQTNDWRRNIEKCYKVGGDVCLQAPNSKVCRALYYSDVAPVLMSLDAEAEIYNGEFTRVPISKIIKKHIDVNGFLKTQDYILTGFYIPYLPKKSWVKFEKYSLRDSLNFPIMNAGVCYSMINNTPEIKIVIGAVSPMPFELTDTQAMIIERFNDLKNVGEEIGEFALKELTRKSLLVRETGWSIKAKRNSFRNILNIIDKLISNIKE